MVIAILHRMCSRCDSVIRPVSIRFLHPKDHTNPSFSPAIQHRSSAAWLQAPKRSSSSFPSQAMHPPPPAQGLRQKATFGAVETMEETMRILTLTELMRLTRTELFVLAARIGILRKIFNFHLNRCLLIHECRDRW
jgi:hypothetical protein